MSITDGCLRSSNCGVRQYSSSRTCSAPSFTRRCLVALLGSKGGLSTCYTMTSFSLNIVCRLLPESYQSVRKWTGKVDLFSKKYVIIPINEKSVTRAAMAAGRANVSLQLPLVSCDHRQPWRFVAITEGGDRWSLHHGQLSAAGVHSRCRCAAS